MVTYLCHSYFVIINNRKLNNFKTEEEKAIDVNRDFRRFICERWVVDPKICFIDRFKWNPPVIDEILRKLQVIFVVCYLTFLSIELRNAKLTGIKFIDDEIGALISRL